MATAFQAEIDTAHTLISGNGQACVIRQNNDGATETTHDHQTFGDISASGGDFTVTSGDLTTVVSVDDEVSFSLISSFANRGPFTVTAVTAATMTVDGSLDTMGPDSEWEMTVTGSAHTDATSVALLLPVSGGARQQFDQAFRDGTLQVSNAKSLLLAAKGLSITPRPGDLIQMGRTTYSDGADTWTIYGINELSPDGAAIIYEGVVTRG